MSPSTGCPNSQQGQNGELWQGQNGELWQGQNGELWVIGAIGAMISAYDPPGQTLTIWEIYVRPPSRQIWDLVNGDQNLVQPQLLAN